jgi:signal transduction histidine kinase
MILNLNFQITTIYNLLFDPRSPVFIDGDKGRIYQVISNLVRNAIKFTKQGALSIQTDLNEIRRLSV